MRSFGLFSQEAPPGSVLVCGDSKVLFVDYHGSKDSIPRVSRRWDAARATELPEAYRTRKFRTIDDCKLTLDGHLLVSSSSGAVAVVTPETGKVRFYATVPNAHSVELLPGNKLAAAASTAPEGNKIMLFDLSRNETVLYTDSLYSAHGLVWDPQRKKLYALGYDVLREYSLSGEGLERGREWRIPGVSGHDLQMAPGNRKLFLTEHTGAWTFDLQTLKFEKIDSFPDAENIKSLGRSTSGQYIYTVPEESWWTYHVRFFNPERTFAFPEMHVYKARWSGR